MTHKHARLIAAWNNDNSVEFEFAYGIGADFTWHKCDIHYVINNPAVNIRIKETSSLDTIIKMEDAFELPLTEDRIKKRLGSAWAIRPEKSKAIAYAVNNIDRLQQENLELRKQLQDSHDWLGIHSGYKSSPLCINNEHLLNKLRS